MSDLKSYLGDGVYADSDGYFIVITTENGIETTNTIALEPAVMRALENYTKALPQRTQRLAAQKQEKANLAKPLSDPQWWAYLHSNGAIQVKRWFGDHKDYTSDCEGNDFVQRVVPPFSAADREEATKIATERLK